MITKTCKICEIKKDITCFGSFLNTIYNRMYWRAECHTCLNKIRRENKPTRVCRGCNIEKNRTEFDKRLCRVCHIDRQTIKKVAVIKEGKYVKVTEREVNNVNKNIINKEVIEFLNKIDKQKGYIDAIDAYYLVSYGVDILGTIYYDKLSIEEELIVTYDKLKKWQKTAFKI